ncbi:hypothetical protein X975_02752, partial [Stegodyphus mimosarum]
MSSVQLMAHFKKLKFAANLSTMYNELPFNERFAAARKSGFDSVEILNPYIMPLEKLKDLKSKNELNVVLINSPPGEEGEFGLACIPGREFDFQMTVKQAIEYAYGLGCPRVHILAGLTNDNFMADDFKQAYVNNVRCAAEMLEEYCLTGLIEPISPAVKENYFLNSFETAVQVLEELQSPQVKLLLDIYHLKMLTGTVDGLVGYLQYSDYIQVSQVPGRHEPSCKGEINYQEVFDLLEQHYSGHIGLEYKPSESTTM